MPTVVLARRAVQDLDSIISSHTLPADAKARVRSILEALADFPRLGQELRGVGKTTECCRGRGDGCCSSIASMSRTIESSW